MQIQKEQIGININLLTNKAKNIISILDLLGSGEDIQITELLARTGYEPIVLVDSLIELFDAGYLLKDRTCKKLAI